MSQILRHSLHAVVTASAARAALQPLTRTVIPSRGVARWKRATLSEMFTRRKRYGIPEEWKQRSSAIEWNYRAELYAFGRRLHEHFDQELLAQAFVDRSYIILEEQRQREVQIENPVVNLKDNAELVVRGDEILREYVQAFLQYNLPKFPTAGIVAVRDHLLSEEKLAHISKNLGTIDIILSDTYPPSEHLLANTLKAIVGARAASPQSGDITSLDATYNFIRDFVCTHLNQVDVNELWPQENAYKILQEVAVEHGIKNVRPRHIGEAARNTLLVAYRIAIYDADTKKMLGTGFGDSVNDGVEIAARNALAKLCGTLNLAPLNYQVDPKECFAGRDAEPTAQISGQ